MIFTLTYIVAPSLMQPRYSRGLAGRPSSPMPARPGLLRLPTNIPGLNMGPVQPTSSTGIQILERADALTRLALDDEAPAVSLIRGFKATIPTSELSKQRRRLIRGGLVDEDLGGKLGLKALGDRARGLLTDGSDEVEAQHEAKRKDKRSRRKKLRERRSTMAHLEGKLHLEDLLQQADEIAQDKDNLAVRQVGLWYFGAALTTSPLSMPRSTRYRARSSSSARSGSGSRRRCSSCRRRGWSSTTSWRGCRS